MMMKIFNSDKILYKDCCSIKKNNYDVMLI